MRAQERRRRRRRNRKLFTAATNTTITTDVYALFVLLLLATSREGGNPRRGLLYLDVEAAFIFSSSSSTTTTTTSLRKSQQQQRQRQHLTNNLQFTSSSSSISNKINKSQRKFGNKDFLFMKNDVCNNNNDNDNDDENNNKNHYHPTFPSFSSSASSKSPQSSVYRNNNYQSYYQNNNNNNNNDDLRDRRYSTTDWFHIMKSIKKSTILRGIIQPVSFIVLWSLLVSVLFKLSLQLQRNNKVTKFMMCTIPLFPHSMVNSALGLLLVFRTNSAYQRFNEGRNIWSNIHTCSRNLSRLTNLYNNDIGINSKYRISILLGTFPYLLANHIIRRRKDDDIIIETLLFPSSSEEESSSLSSETQPESETRSTTTNIMRRAEFIASTNRPVWVCNQLGEEIMKIKYSDNYTSRERSTFLSYVGKLSTSVGQCERITQTSTPQNYARHALRSLSIWLATLPFALIKEFGMLTPIVTGLTAWLMFGVYQIGAIIEDPFQGSLKVQTMCDAIYNDVMCDDTNHKNPLNNGGDDDDDNYNDNKNNNRENAYYCDDDEGKDNNIITSQPPVENLLATNHPTLTTEGIHHNHTLHHSETATTEGSLSEERSNDHITAEKPPSPPLHLGRTSIDEFNP